MPAISAAMSAMAFSSAAKPRSAPARAPLDPHGCSARSAPRAPPRATSRRAAPGVAPAPGGRRAGGSVRQRARPGRAQWPLPAARPGSGGRSARTAPPVPAHRFAAVSHACRVFSSHSRFMNERVFSAPPFSGVGLIGPLEPLFGVPVVTIEAPFRNHQMHVGILTHRPDGSPSCRAIAPPR